MLKINEVVVVEGKYDKIRLASVIDATILTTNGFGIYKDKQRMALLRRLARERGLVLVTDSDAAGFQIRAYLMGCIPKEQIKHVYIPDVFGKERRKDRPSAEGKLGVEGMDTQSLVEAFRRAGIGTQESVRPRREIQKADLYLAGLSGGTKASVRRAALKARLALPERLSPNGLLDVLNLLLTYEEWTALIKEMGWEEPDGTA